MDICKRCHFLMADARPDVAKYIHIEQKTVTVNGNTESMQGLEHDHVPLLSSKFFSGNYTSFY